MRTEFIIISLHIYVWNTGRRPEKSKRGKLLLKLDDKRDVRCRQDTARRTGRFLLRRRDSADSSNVSLDDEWYVSQISRFSLLTWVSYPGLPFWKQRILDNDLGTVCEMTAQMFRLLCCFDAQSDSNHCNTVEFFCDSSEFRTSSPDFDPTQSCLNLNGQKLTL